MKTYMIWIPGKVIWTGTETEEALQEFAKYVRENERNIDTVKLTVYESTVATGKQPEFSITGREALKLMEQDADS